ncbi:hypothetical protein [Aquipuribacter nitratireducens]|uniref:Uncharacterized protein n=1 Tax=Aquipuribacter nitratireducens TaxID=650104 RepID=A0ABW0GP15_9MICO
MLRFLRGRTADGEVSPAARLVAVLVVVAMLVTAAPLLVVATRWLVGLL